MGHIKVVVHAVDVIGQEQRIAALGLEGIELGDGAMYKLIRAAIDIDGCAQRVAHLCVGKHSRSACQTQTVAGNVVHNAVLH